MGSCPTSKYSKSTTPPTQILTEELKAVDFQKDTMEHRDESIPKTILSFMAYQHSDSHVENNFRDFKKQLVCRRQKNIK